MYLSTFLRVTPLKEIYDHCSEVLLHLERKFGTVRSGPIDKKSSEKGFYIFPRRSLYVSIFVHVKCRLVWTFPAPKFVGYFLLSLDKHVLTPNTESGMKK